MRNNWLDTSEYPFTSKYFTINENKMHFIDEGCGDIILFIHGTPSWSFDFRNVIKALRNDFRCIAIDHIGFGLSDKPENYDYSTQNHSKTLEVFVFEKKLRNISLVVHDFGTLIGMDFAIRNSHVIKNLIILNSWLWNTTEDPSFARQSKIIKSPLLPLLYCYLNFSPKYILPRSFGKHKLSKHLLGHYTKPFASRRQRNGTLAFARSLVNDQDWFQKLWENKTTVSSKPALFVWGMNDPIIKPNYLEKFVSGFPDAEVVKLETCGHFPQAEHPEIVAKSIRDFLKR